MDVEVRYVEGCANLPVIRRRLACALDAIGRADVDVRLRQIHTDAEAAEIGFSGSPTILLNGLDPFPATNAVVGLTCRLYRSADGFGVPTVEQLTAALRRADGIEVLDDGPAD